MKTAFLYGVATGLALLTCLLVASCRCCKKEGSSAKDSSLEATLLVYSVHRQTDYVDMNGNSPAPRISRTDTIVVRKGSEFDSFVVTKVGEKSVDIESKYLKYYCSETRRTSNSFSLERGKSYALSVADLLDAEETTHIEVK